MIKTWSSHDQNMIKLIKHDEHMTNTWWTHEALHVVHVRTYVLEAGGKYPVNQVTFVFSDLFTVWIPDNLNFIMRCQTPSNSFYILRHLCFFYHRNPVFKHDTWTSKPFFSKMQFSLCIHDVLYIKFTVYYEYLWPSYHMNTGAVDLL